MYTFIPPASPVPGCSNGDVCTDSTATLRGQIAEFRRDPRSEIVTLVHSRCVLLSATGRRPPLDATRHAPAIFPNGQRGYSADFARQAGQDTSQSMTSEVTGPASREPVISTGSPISAESK